MFYIIEYFSGVSQPYCLRLSTGTVMNPGPLSIIIKAVLEVNQGGEV